MSDTTEIHIDNIGTKLRVTVHDQDGVRDISDASSVVFMFTKSNGTDFEVTGSFVTDGSDGKIEYEFVDGDLDVKGVWRYQLRVHQNSKVFYTDIGSFKVFSNL